MIRVAKAGPDVDLSPFHLPAVNQLQCLLDQLIAVSGSFTTAGTAFEPRAYCNYIANTLLTE